MTKVAGFLVVLALLTVLAGPGDTVWAQGVDLFATEECQENPHTELCICGEVRKFGGLPVHYEPDDRPPDAASVVWTAPDAEGGEEVPSDVAHFNEETELWEGKTCAFDEIDKDTCGLLFVYNDQYGQQCALSYVRENLRRLYFFVAAVGAGFAAISMTWAGVVYMQESSSGMDLTRARGMMIRVLIGLVVLASALMGWEGVNDLLLQHVESWTQDRGTYYRLE